MSHVTWPGSNALADLHQSGLLTDEEFAAKRATIVEKL
jgi:hypothetical protein